MPAIVLLNLEDVSYLKAKEGDPKYNKDKAAYWSKSALVYEMGKNKKLTREKCLSLISSN